MIVYSQQQETLDALCWRVLGRSDNATLTAALDANPHLADLGDVLPSNTAVILPAALPEPQVDVVRLWQ